MVDVVSRQLYMLGYYINEGKKEWATVIDDTKYIMCDAPAVQCSIVARKEYC